MKVRTLLLGGAIGLASMAFAAPAHAAVGAMACNYQQGGGYTTWSCTTDLTLATTGPAVNNGQWTSPSGATNGGTSGTHGQGYVVGETTIGTISLDNGGNTFSATPTLVTYGGGYPAYPSTPTTTTTTTSTTTTTAPPTTTTTSGSGTTTTTSGTNEVALIASAGATAKDTLLVIAGGALLIGAAIYALRRGWQLVKQNAS